MNREQILSAILKNQPARTELPVELIFSSPQRKELIEKFVERVNFIGGKVIPIQNMLDINQYVVDNYKSTDRVVTLIPELKDFTSFTIEEDPRNFENVVLAIVKSHFGVAENGSVWITEDQMGHRVIPFICQHLVMVVNSENILANMHVAYEVIQTQDYDFGTFIAGPSKTADIEQSLVLGAHGPRSLTIFLI